MDIYYINQKRINRLKLPDNYDKKTIQIGIPVKKDEAEKVGLEEIGDSILPSQHFGATSKKNADGYEYADKTKPKQRRYVTTNWIKPYGNSNASEQAVDIYRECYPKITVEPTEIELTLHQNKHNDMFVIASMSTLNRSKHIKEAINIFLEIYGECYVYKKEIEARDINVKKKKNWEFLRPGEKPSKNIIRNTQNNNELINKYDIERLITLEKYDKVDIVEGILGFRGYYAFLFKKYCIFESVWYGNATYIVAITNWEKLSQLTKSELMALNEVEKRIIHNADWGKNITRFIEDNGLI